ncbi:MAG TPA: type VI secretion system baseplate subunit TssE [Pseudomonas sp.]|nr:type VI secretion system baseplate subunit TssE [Pseudomonas sp.]
MGAPSSGLYPPLFDRLAAEDDADTGAPTPGASGGMLDRDALADSVRAELLRLFNTRRATRPYSSQLSIIDYGLPDWSALHGARAEDRRQLARGIRDAVLCFEPRLQVQDVEVLPVPGQQHAVRIRLVGGLRGAARQWPVAFVIDMAAEGYEVHHERLD